MEHVPSSELVSRGTGSAPSYWAHNGHPFTGVAVDEVSGRVVALRAHRRGVGTTALVLARPRG